MARFPIRLEDEIEADSPEDAAIILRDLLKQGVASTIFAVDVAGGRVIVDTEVGNESVVRDDRNRIGPVVKRREGPTGVVTSPVMARFYEHAKVDSLTDLEVIEGIRLRLRGCGDEAYYEWVNADGSVSDPFAVITVKREFASLGTHPPAQQAVPGYAAHAQH